jgi:tRNA 2-thiouridine synthesizing protein A
MSMSTTMVDARGMRCPWPALRLARALRGGPESVELLADDPAAERECRAVADSAGYSFAALESGRFRARVNTSFTRQP